MRKRIHTAWHIDVALLYIQNADRLRVYATSDQAFFTIRCGVGDSLQQLSVVLFAYGKTNTLWNKGQPLL